MLGHLTSQFFVERWKADGAEVGADAEVDFNYVTAIRKLLDLKVEPNTVVPIPVANSTVVRLLRSESKAPEECIVVEASAWECFLVHVFTAAAEPAAVEWGGRMNQTLESGPFLVSCSISKSSRASCRPVPKSTCRFDG